MNLCVALAANLRGTERSEVAHACARSEPCMNKGRALLKALGVDG